MTLREATAVVRGMTLTERRRAVDQTADPMLASVSRWALDDEGKGQFAELCRELGLLTLRPLALEEQILAELSDGKLHRTLELQEVLSTTGQAIRRTVMTLRRRDLHIQTTSVRGCAYYQLILKESAA